MAGYQIKVTIEGTKPPMWRRLIVPDRITFEALHQILQVTFGWWDYHLHDFEFQHMGMSVGDMESADVEYEEREYRIDELLQDGWIRYTYDFGDDWRHKIVLEKVLPDYKFRYPQVIKYKRNNFEEDSGGVWGGSDSDGEPYDMDEVNAKLQNCCVFKASRKHKKLIVESDSFPYGSSAYEQTVEKMLQDFAGMLNTVEMLQKEQERRANAEPSVYDELFGEIDEFYDELGVGQEFEQVRIIPPASTMEQILQLTGEIHLRDDLKYLGIPVKKSWKVSTMAKRVAECLKNHPEYLMLLLKEDEMDWLLRAYCAKQVLLPEMTTVIILASWGVAEPSLIRRGKSQKTELQLSFTKEGIQMIQQLQQSDLKQHYRGIEETWKRIYLLLGCYGYLELDTLYEKYVCAFGMIDREEFERCVYLRGRFCANLATGFDWRGNQWVAAEEEIAYAVMEARRAYAMKKPKLELPSYADFTKEQILSMERGFAELYPQWDAVRELLDEVCDDGQMMDELMSELYRAIISGFSLEIIMRYVCDILPEMNRIEQERIRTALRRCWCEMGIPALNGHSRKEIAQLNHMRVEAVVPELDSGRTEEKQEEAEMQIAPDAPCPCGSGKRYRQCCGRSKL